MMTTNAAKQAQETIVSQPRRAPPRWAQLSVLFAMFAAGSIVGAMVATKVIHSRMAYYRENPDALPDDIVPRLQARLALTEKQSVKVREIVARRHPQMIEQRRQGAQAMLNQFQVMENEIASVLDPEQEQMWRQIAASVRQRFLPPAPGID